MADNHKSKGMLVRFSDETQEQIELTSKYYEWSKTEVVRMATEIGLMAMNKFSRKDIVHTFLKQLGLREEFHTELDLSDEEMERIKESAQLCSVDVKSTILAREIDEFGIPELKEAVRDGKLNIQAGVNIARLRNNDQLQALEQLEQFDTKRFTS